MNYVPDDPDDIWKLSIERWMIRIAMHDPDPEETFADWLDEAADGDEKEYMWARWTWEEVGCWNSLELERRLKIVESQLAVLRELGQNR